MRFSMISTFFLGLGVGIILGGGFQSSAGFSLFCGILYALPSLLGEE